MARFNGNSFRFSWEEQKSHSGTYTTICGIGLLLLVILLPLSFSYVEYHEYGLKQRKSTGTVDVSKVYDSGRYAIVTLHTLQERVWQLVSAKATHRNW